MESQRQEYPTVLATLQPEQAVDVLNNRIAVIGQINTSIADFLQERRRIEERYATDLRKLARRPQQDSGAALGIFQMPWQRIISGTENLAQSHETLASKIESDVETPLRQYAAKSREMQAIGTVQGNIASIARDLTKAKDKADKLSARGGKKAGDASTNVEEATREWESQAPYVFEQLQALDENRLNHLRDVLTQFQTHEVDQVERNRTSAESCLNALLNIETADEIKTFAVKVSQGKAVLARRASIASSSAPAAVPPVPPPPRNQEQRSKNTTSEEKANTEATPHKSKMGGLKRLGTVMSRRKSAAPPPPQNAEKKREKTRSIMPFRRGDSSRSFQDLEATGQDLTPITSRADVPGSRQGPASPVRNAVDDTPVTRNTTEIAMATTNGLPATHTGSTNEAPLPSLPTIIPSTQLFTQTDMQETSTNGREDPFAPTTNEVPTAAETEEFGRNLKIRDQPIQEDAGEAQVAMNNMANQLRLQAQNSGIHRAHGSVRGRRDVRNTMFIPGNQEIPGLSQASSSAGAGISNIPESPSALQMAPVNTAARISNALETTAVQRSVTGMSLDDHATTSDTTSIHSAHSLAPVAHHPELHVPGLNASVVETVSTWFSETGIAQSSIVGEVAFAHINAPNLTPQEQETIRLQNFQVLEKVAANPTFVTPHQSPTATAEERAGSYIVSLSAIRRTIPTVGLKYKIHLDDSNLANYSPVLITPAWQIVQGQVSVIVMYGLNPAFSLPNPAADELVLKNVAISVNLDTKDPSSGKPTAAMMAPTQGASFRRKAAAVTWRFPELKIHQAQERLLVRFTTEGGLAHKGGIELKFEVPDVTASSLGVEKSSASVAIEANPFADVDQPANESGWTAVPTKRLLVTGRYSAT